MDHSTEARADPARPPLAGLDMICVVARLGSLSAAAAELGVTHGAVSRRLAAVEAWLGQLLFERHARGVRLTPDGQRFLGSVEQAFALIDGAADQWRRKRGPDVVRLSVVPSFAKLWLLPRLEALERGEPRVRIELSVEHRHADLETGEVDLAVRYGRGPWRNVESQPLARETLFPFANEPTAEKLGRDPAPGRLLAAPLLHDSDASGWRAWFAGAGVDFKARPTDRRFEDYTLVLAAAEAGLGVALMRSPLADDYWAQTCGLVRLSDRAAFSLTTYHLVTRVRETKPAVKIVADRLLAALGPGVRRYPAP